MAVYNFGTAVGMSDADFTAAVSDFRSDTEQSNPSLSIYDEGAPEIATARTLADEMINISGAPVRIYLRTNNADYDYVWEEDPDPTYWNPIDIKGFYKPSPLEMELKKWGVDTINRSEIIFSHKQIYDLCGERMLRAGDVIEIKYNSANKSTNPKHYRVINATPSGNFRYVWLYMTCNIETLTADVAVKPVDDIGINDDQMEQGYRETI